MRYDAADFMSAFFVPVHIIIRYQSNVVEQKCPRSFAFEA